MSSLIKSIRILPAIIFLSVLTLSLKVSNLIEAFKSDSVSILGISELRAAENPTPEAEVLSSALEQSQYQDSSSQKNASPSTFTQSEIQILQELAERREALDLRSKEIDKKALQLMVSEKEIDKRLKQMEEYEQKLKLLIQEYNSKEREKILSLVKVYASMKPKDAARIFETLDLEVTVALLKEMKPSVSSAILAQITPVKAKAITDKIIGNSF